MAFIEHFAGAAPLLGMSPGHVDRRWLALSACFRGGLRRDDHDHVRSPARPARPADLNGDVGPGAALSRACSVAPLMRDDRPLHASPLVHQRLKLAPGKVPAQAAIRPHPAQMRRYGSTRTVSAFGSSPRPIGGYLRTR